MGDKMRRRRQDEKTFSIGVEVAATMGLLAFLLAITFGMSVTRFDVRKDMVVQEAKAIESAYLLADFLPEDDQAEVKSLLRQYTLLRAEGRSSIVTAENIEKSRELQDRLWAIATIAGKESDSNPMALFIQSLATMIATDTARVASYLNRLPDEIWIMLSLVTVFSMASLGYEFGLTGERSWAATIFLMVAFATVIILIADLDRPDRGFVLVSQQPLLNLLEWMGAPVP
jgi:hypothetical protein